MGRRGKPTHFHELEGTRDRRPEQLRRLEPRPQGDLSDPPDWITGRCREMWYDAIERAPFGLLKLIDEGIFTGWVMAAWIFTRAAEAQADCPDVIRTPSGKVVPSPYITIMNTQQRIMKALAAELGFTPVSRSRIAVEAGPDPEDPADRFFD